jgi:hypothetical protein
MVKCFASIRPSIAIPGPPKGQRQYVEALDKFRRLWDLPAEQARAARMDQLIILIDEYEVTAKRLVRSG